MVNCSLYKCAYGCANKQFCEFLQGLGEDLYVKKNPTKKVLYDDDRYYILNKGPTDQNDPYSTVDLTELINLYNYIVSLNNECIDDVINHFNTIIDNNKSIEQLKIFKMKKLDISLYITYPIDEVLQMIKLMGSNIEHMTEFINLIHNEVSTYKMINVKNLEDKFTTLLQTGSGEKIDDLIKKVKNIKEKLQTIKNFGILDLEGFNNPTSDNLIKENMESNEFEEIVIDFDKGIIPEKQVDKLKTDFSKDLDDDIIINYNFDKKTNENVLNIIQNKNLIFSNEIINLKLKITELTNKKIVMLDLSNIIYDEYAFNFSMTKEDLGSSESEKITQIREQQSILYKKIDYLFKLYEIVNENEKKIKIFQDSYIDANGSTNILNINDEKLNINNLLAICTEIYTDTVIRTDQIIFDANKLYYEIFITVNTKKFTESRKVAELINLMPKNEYKKKNLGKSISHYAIKEEIENLDDVKLFLNNYKNITIILLSVFYEKSFDKHLQDKTPYFLKVKNLLEQFSEINNNKLKIKKIKKYISDMNEISNIIDKIHEYLKLYGDNINIITIKSDLQNKISTSKKLFENLITRKNEMEKVLKDRMINLPTNNIKLINNIIKKYDEFEKIKQVSETIKINNNLIGGVIKNYNIPFIAKNSSNFKTTDIANNISATFSEIMSVTESIEHYSGTIFNEIHSLTGIVHEYKKLCQDYDNLCNDIDTINKYVVYYTNTIILALKSYSTNSQIILYSYDDVKAIKGGITDVNPNAKILLTRVKKFYDNLLELFKNKQEKYLFADQSKVTFIDLILLHFITNKHK